MKTNATTFKVKTGCGNLFITVNYDDDEEIIEITSTLGKNGDCIHGLLQSLCGVITIALQNGAGIMKIQKQLSGVRCPQPMWSDGNQILSCPDAIAYVIKCFLQNKSKIWA